MLKTISAIACWIGVVAAPSYAQVDLAGEWGAKYTWDYQERLPGPELGDYTGLPINQAARLKADSWEASVQTLPERQAFLRNYIENQAALLSPLVTGFRKVLCQ